MLYPHIAIDYEQLHSSSIAVRYGLGLGPYESAALVKDFDHIADAYVAGQLRAR